MRAIAPLLIAIVIGQATPLLPSIEGTPNVAPDGTEVAVDLPTTEKKRNTGGRDGAGLCVFTSIEYCARWQNERRLVDFQKEMKKEPGGGYPQKVDKMIAKYGAGTPYIQYEGGDMSIMKDALKSGRGCAVTWGSDHMICLFHLDDKWAAVCDNNSPERIQWLTPEAFKRKWTAGGRSGWTVILLAPPPPPIPKN